MKRFRLYFVIFISLLSVLFLILFNIYNFNDSDNLLKDLVIQFDKTTDRICKQFKIQNKNQIQKLNQIQETLHLLNENPTETVYDYVPGNLSDKYSSHSIPLTIAALITQGDILELGMGRYSTPILNRIAIEQNRFLVSIESDLDWMNSFKELNNTKRHLIIPSTSECAFTINQSKRWGLVFVDHLNAETRKFDVINYAKKAQIVVAHDTERAGNDFYGFNYVYKHFKYHCKYSLMYPDKSYLSTSILSNFISLNLTKKLLKRVKTDLAHIACDQSL